MKRNTIPAGLLALLLAFCLLAGCGAPGQAGVWGVTALEPSASAAEEATSLPQEPSSSAAEAEMPPVVSRGEGVAVYRLGASRDGLEISAYLCVPDGESSAFPTVLLAHGFGGNYNAMLPYAQALAASGFASVLFDFCGGGSESEGDPLEMSALTEADDMEAVLDAVLACPAVDRQHIFVLGESQGGLVAALLAARRASDVCAAVLVCPAFSLPDMAHSAYPDGMIPETAELFGVPVGRRYYHDLFTLDVYEEIAAFHGDVLLLHGTEDATVPISYSERALEAYDSAELVRIEGAGHHFTEPERETLHSAMLGFLQDCLAA